MDQLATQVVLVPGALKNTLMIEDGVLYGQTVVDTKVQKQNTTQIKIRQAIPPDDATPGLTAVAHVEVSYQ